MCCGPLPGCLIHIKAPAIIYIMSLPPPPAALPPSPSSRPYVRVHVCLHAHARAGSPSCTDRQALTQTVTHNDSQSSHIRAETKVHRIWRAHGRPQVLNDDAPGHTAAWFCFLRPSPAHPRNCSVSFSSPHSRLIFF